MSDIQQLIEQLSSPNYHESREAAVALKALGPQAVEPLIAALGSANETIPYYVIPALAEIGDVRAVEPFVKLLDSKDGNVIKESVKGLGRFSDEPRAVEALKRFARTPKNRLRAVAIHILRQMNAQKTGLDFWLDVAQTENDPAILWQAAEQLGKLGDASAFDPLKTLIDKWPGNNSVIRFSFDAWLKLDKKPDVDVLLFYLKSDDPITRGYAARSLGVLGDIRAIDRLNKFLADQANVYQEEPAQYVTVGEMARAAIQQIEKANGIK